MDPQPAHGHRVRYLCTRTRAHLQPRHLQFSSCRGFRSRPQRMSTNSVAGGVRPEPAGSSAWDDLSAQGSSVAIGSSDSIAQGKDCSCKPPAFPPLHNDVHVPQSTGCARAAIAQTTILQQPNSPIAQYLANSPICAFDSAIGSMRSSTPGSKG